MNILNMNRKRLEKNGLKYLIVKYSPEEKLKDSDFPGYVKLQEIVVSEQVEEVWIYQPFIGPFDLSFENSGFFRGLEKLVLEERKKYDYQGMVTATLFEKDGSVLTHSTQNVGLHNLTVPQDEFWWLYVQKYFPKSFDKSKVQQKLAEIMSREKIDVREALKKVTPIPSGSGYEINPGSDPENHSEARALYRYFGVQKEADYLQALKDPVNSQKVQDLQNSTCYLYGHWWSCKDCSRKMEAAGIKKLILSKEWVKKYLNLD